MKNEIIHKNILQKEINDEILEFIKSSFFINHLKTICNDVINQLSKRLFLTTSPLICIIITLIIYIFTVLNYTVETLKNTTDELNVTVKLFQQSLQSIDDRTKENSETIKIILKKL